MNEPNYYNIIGTDPSVSTKKLNKILEKQKSQKKIDSKLLQKIEDTLTDYHSRKSYDFMLSNSLSNPIHYFPSIIPLDLMKKPKTKQSYMESISTSMTLNPKGNYNVEEEQIVNNNGKVKKRKELYELLPSGKKIPMISNKK